MDFIFDLFFIILDCIDFLCMDSNIRLVNKNKKGVIN